MAFAGHCGIDLNLNLEDEIFKFLFNEELGAVIQILDDDVIEILKYFNNELGLAAQVIGAPNKKQSIKIYNESNLILESSRGQVYNRIGQKQAIKYNQFAIILKPLRKSLT